MNAVTRAGRDDSLAANFEVLYRHYACDHDQMATEELESQCWFVAIQGNCPKIAQILAHYSASVDRPLSDNAGPPLVHSIAFDRVDIAKCLLSSSCNANATNKACKDSALHVAVRHHKIELVHLLLEHGADAIGVFNRQGDNALLEACFRARDPACRLDVLYLIVRKSPLLWELLTRE